MPPRGGTTAWTSERIGIRPPPHKTSAQKSEKGKGRAKTPEPARSPAIRKLDELLAGLRSSSSSSSSSSSRQNTTTPDAGCFCQGASVLAPNFFSNDPPIPPHTLTPTSTHTPALRIYTPLHDLRSDPLHPPKPIHPLSLLQLATSGRRIARSVDRTG